MDLLFLKGWSHKGGIKPRVLGPTFNSIVSYTSPTDCRRPDGVNLRQQCGGGGGHGSSGKHRITYKRYVKPCVRDHDLKNMALNRPMSPHLAIFTMTTPAAMSILQRITGILIASYALLLSGGTLFLSNGIETYVSIIQSLDLGETPVLMLKLLLGLPFTYHYCNGIRFCMWNANRWLDMKIVSRTAALAAIGTVAGAVFFALK